MTPEYVAAKDRETVKEKKAGKPDAKEPKLRSDMPSNAAYFQAGNLTLADVFCSTPEVCVA